MSKNKNKDGRAAVLIHLRYVLPVLLCLVLIALMFVPNLRYSVKSGTVEEMSVAVRLDSDWNAARVALFGSSELSPLGENFYRVLIVLIPLLAVLFIIGFLSTVAVSVVGLIYINSYEFRRTRERIWFVTLLPNRIVAFALQALMLPLLFYSRIIVILFEKVYNTDVLLNVSFPEAWVFGLIFYGLTVGLSVWSLKYEKKLDADPFKRIVPPAVKVIDREELYERVDEPIFKTEAEREYYERQKRARQEQAERIRKLLNKDEDEN